MEKYNVNVSVKEYNMIVKAIWNGISNTIPNTTIQTST